MCMGRIYSLCVRRSRLIKWDFKVRCAVSVGVDGACWRQTYTHYCSVDRPTWGPDNYLQQVFLFLQGTQVRWASSTDGSSAFCLCGSDDAGRRLTRLLPLAASSSRSGEGGGLRLAGDPSPAEPSIPAARLLVVIKKGSDPAVNSKGRVVSKGCCHRGRAQFSLG